MSKAGARSSGITELRGVDDGLLALNHGDIGRYRFAPGGAERDAWGAALFALTRAKFHPRPDKTEMKNLLPHRRPETGSQTACARLKGRRL